jgi:two-component system phosphate regulon sensor histidine kinase PhoR
MPRVSVFRSTFFWKIYATFSLLFLVSTSLVSGVVFVHVQKAFRDDIAESLDGRAIFLTPEARRVLTVSAPAADLTRELAQATASRVTFIGADGRVVADSERTTESMENHLARPEIQAALRKGTGSAERASDTTSVNTFYFARAVRDGERLLGFVRIAVPTASLDAEMSSLWSTIAAISLAGIVLALGLGWTLARRIMVPISEMVIVAEALRAGHYQRRVRRLRADELGRLGATLNQLGAEMTKKISELERLENVRRDFVANVSHEIKTPLTSIKGYVETLLAGAIDDPDHRLRFLEKIDRNAERLTSLVQDILSLAKIEAAEGSLTTTPTEWNPIIASVIARHEDAIQKKGLRLRVNLQAAPIVVQGDKEAMTQVLDNLLTNAVKYTPDGGKITVSLAPKTPWARLEVEDTGIGIPAEHLDRIFERFYRIDKARSRDLGGTGLGLSIVKHLVSAMSGEVGVESAVGIGSKFSVKLKLVD